MALTAWQWRTLVQATDTRQAFAGIEQAAGHDPDTKSGRYEARDLIAAVLRRWLSTRTLSEVRDTFAGTSVSWGPYQTFRQLVLLRTSCG